MNIERFNPTGHNCFTVLDEHGRWVAYEDHLAEVERTFAEAYDQGDASGQEAMRAACIAAVEALMGTLFKYDEPAWVEKEEVLAALREVQP